MEERTEENPLPAFAQKIKNPFILAALRGDNTGLVFKYIGGTLLILGAFVVGQAMTSLLVLAAAFFSGVKGEAMTKPELLAQSIDKNLFLVFAIFSFMVGVLGIWLVVKFIHRRKFLSLITPYAKLNWKKIGLAFGIYFVLSGAVEYIFYLQDPGNYVLHFNAGRFALLLLIVVVLLPIQTSFEELFFRGYLMQGFGLLFRNTIPAMIITAILFGLMHSGNPEIAKFGFWVMFPYYVGFGLLLGFIAMVDKSLEIPLAVHAANNIFSSLFITFEGSALETDAIFYQKQMDPAASLPYYFASMFLFLLICSLVFGWWKRKISEPGQP